MIERKFPAMPHLHETKRWEHRVRTPETTLKRLQGIFGHVGITRIADITDLDFLGIPVFQAIRPMGKSLSVSQGKGMTKAAAKVSAVMEAIELWHAETDRKPDLVTSPSKLGSTQYADPNLMRLPNTKNVPASDPIPWMAASDAVTDETVYVPLDATSMDFTRKARPSVLGRNSNGLASGNTMAEAMAHGLAEVIERSCQADFLALNLQDQAARRISAPHLAGKSQRAAKIIEPILANGLELELFDITNHFQVPAVRAVLAQRASAGPMQHPVTGHGAHLDPVTALTRAITEAAQSRLAYIAGNRDDFCPEFYAKGELNGIIRAVHRGMDQPPATDRYDLTDKSGSAPQEDLEIMLELVLKKGCGPVICCDLSDPYLKIPVAKMIAPKTSYLPPR